MVLYGEEEEEMMEKSKDPVIKEIWDNKIVEEYAPTPKVRKACMGELFGYWATFPIFIED